MRDHHGPAARPQLVGHRGAAVRTRAARRWDGRSGAQLEQARTSPNKEVTMW